LGILKVLKESKGTKGKREIMVIKGRKENAAADGQAVLP